MNDQRLRALVASDRFFKVASPLLAIVLWEAVSQLGLVDRRFLPPPSSVLQTLQGLVTSGELLYHTGWTMLRFLAGLLLGALPGLLLGVTMGLFRTPRIILDPLVAIGYPLPRIALFPIVLILLGLNELSNAVMVALGVFFVVLINAQAGVMNIDRVYLDIARSYRAGTRDMYRRIVLPGALPVIFAGLRLGVGMAFLGAIAVEFLVSGEGLGYLIWHSWLIFSMKLSFAGLMVIGVLGFLSFVGLEAAERVLIPWKTSGR